MPTFLRSARLLTTLLVALPFTPTWGQSQEGAKSDANVLQVQIIVPPQWVPMLEDDITDTFVSRIRDVFRRQDFAGGIKEVKSYDEPDPGCCLLSIHLVDWRINHAGNIDCTFTATLQTAKTTRNLGFFSDTAFRWMSGPGRFGLADAFEEAADGAIRQLHRQLARTELVPGLRAR